MPSIKPPQLPTDRPLVIAIDGPAGAGKSSVARELARRLGISYLDTGAMYRALTLKALTEKIKLDDEDALVVLAKRTQVDLKPTADQGLQILLDGRDVTDDIRSLEVTNNTFYIARAAKVREILVTWQRRTAQSTGVVAEGRDIGTVVFPNATYKFYLDANPEERARRRIAELRVAGKTVDEAALKKEIMERDQKDLTRAAGPLKKADDAIVVDSTGLSVGESVDRLIELMDHHG